MYRSYCFYFSYPGLRDFPFQFFKKFSIGRVQILKIHRGTGEINFFSYFIPAYENYSGFQFAS